MNKKKHKGVYMSFIESMKKRAKMEKKTIVLPETMDKRILEAAYKILED